MEAAVPIVRIRAHTKTEDVPAVTDDQLELYRSSAFEACQEYTGTSWTGRVFHRQPIALSERAMNRRTGNVRVRLDLAPTDGILTMEGGHAVRTIYVPPNAADAWVPMMSRGIDHCDPDACKLNAGYSLAYWTGVADPTDVPAGIVHGILKFIAWSVEHAGDNLTSIDGMNIVGASMAGTNDDAIASGAVEMWRRYRVRRNG